MYTFNLILLNSLILLIFEYLLQLGGFYENGYYMVMSETALLNKKYITS